MWVFKPICMPSTTSSDHQHLFWIQQLSIQRNHIQGCVPIICTRTHRLALRDQQSQGCSQIALCTNISHRTLYSHLLLTWSILYINGSLHYVLLTSPYWPTVHSYYIWSMNADPLCKEEERRKERLGVDAPPPQHPLHRYTPRHMWMGVVAFHLREHHSANETANDLATATKEILRANRLLTDIGGLECSWMPRDNSCNPWDGLYSSELLMRRAPEAMPLMRLQR
jgi:hypothetical protein